MIATLQDQFPKGYRVIVLDSNGHSDVRVGMEGIVDGYKEGGVAVKFNDAPFTSATNPHVRFPQTRVCHFLPNQIELVVQVL